MKRLVLILVITAVSLAGAAMVSVASKNHAVAVSATTDDLHIALPPDLKKLPVEQLLPLP